MLALEVLIELLLKHRPRRRHLREQGRARSQLHIVGEVKDCASGPALDAQGRLCTLNQPLAENRVAQVRLDFRDAFDCVLFGRLYWPLAL